MLAADARAVLREQAAAALWERGILAHKLWPQQRVIYDVIRALPIDVVTVVVLCARQFGKSVLDCLMALEDCLQHPNIVNLIIGPTIKQTREIVYPRIKLLTQDIPKHLILEPFPKVSQDTFYFANGSELKLGGFETGAASQRGKTIHKIYIEETCDSDGDAYIDFLRSDLVPALTHSKHAQVIHFTTLPKIPDHPFVFDTIPEAEVNGAFFKFTIDDNRQLTQAKYDACVKLCGGKHTIAFRREYLCEQVRDASIILAPEFSEEQHVREEITIPEYAHFWIGGDVGGIRDYSVFLLCAYDFKRAKVLFLDERSYSPETGSGEMVAGVKEMESGRKCPRHVDMPGQLQVDMAYQHNFPCSLPRKDELEASINQLRVALQTNALEISSKCKMLIATLRSGTFNAARTDLARTATLGHMDAAMAAVYSLRHADKRNPYPEFGDARPHTHHMPVGKKQALDVLFGGVR